MFKIIIQNASDSKKIPPNTLLRQWARAALKKRIAAAEVTIRIIDTPEMSALNTTYRHKNGPTNVLSFPFDMPSEMSEEIPILGDIVICVDVVEREACEQKKTTMSHWAHMVVHGTLHLLGYDHEAETDALIMESQEIDILNVLNFPNPYETIN